MNRFILVAILVTGCGGPEQISDDSMGADKHREAAEEHHEQASNHDLERVWIS